MATMIEHETAAHASSALFALGFVILTLPVGMLVHQPVPSAGGEAMSDTVLLFDAPGPRALPRTASSPASAVALAWRSRAGCWASWATKGQLSPAKWSPFLRPTPGPSTSSPACRHAEGRGDLDRPRAAPSAWSSASAGSRSSRRSAGSCSVVVEFFRAVPVLLMMLFAFALYSTNNVFGLDSSLAPSSPALTLYNGAVIAELVRAGVDACPAASARRGSRSASPQPDAALDPAAAGAHGDAAGAGRPARRGAQGLRAGLRHHLRGAARQGQPGRHRRPEQSSPPSWSWPCCSSSSTTG